MRLQKRELRLYSSPVSLVALADEITNSIRRILSQLEPNSEPLPKDKPLPLHDIESIRMGTTVSTNALLERNGEKCALITSKGWGDILLIGMQGEFDFLSSPMCCPARY